MGEAKCLWRWGELVVVAFGCEGSFFRGGMVPGGYSAVGIGGRQDHHIFRAASVLSAGPSGSSDTIPAGMVWGVLLP